MKADRELDARIAEDVMGWIPWLEKRGEYTHVVWQKDEMEPYRRSRNWESQVERYTKTTWSEIDPMEHVVYEFFKPSTQIADAWLVVEKLGGVVGIDRFPKYDDPDEWYWDVGFNKGTAQADTAPLAICLAALAVVERRE